MEKQEKEIMYESDEAAVFKTGISGWISADGRFFGNSKDAEHMARYAGCTHHIAECGHKAERHWLKCENCRAKQDRERFFSYPEVPWDGSTPIVIFDDDKYFFSEDDLLEYCEDNECSPSDLMLCLCKPNYLRQVDESYWEDVFPEDQYLDDVADKAVLQALKALNLAIKNQGPVSWSQDKIRIAYTQ